MRLDLIRGSDSKMKSISVFSISGSSYFSGNVDLHSGGSERQMKYIVDILAREKVQVTVMTANSVGRSSNRIENVSYVNLWRKDSGILSKMFFLTVNLFRVKSAIYLRGVSPVHLLVIIISRIAMKRVILGMTSDVQCVKGEALKTTLVRKLSFLFSSRIVAQTNFQASLLRLHYKQKSAVLNNVLDIQEIGQDEDVKYYDKSYDVIWIGYMEPRKGLDHVVELADRLQNKKFVVVGDGRQDHLEYADRVIKLLRNRNNVDVVGRVDPLSVGSFISRSKVLVNTSLTDQSGVTKEGFPNAFLESWCLGVPVVALNVDPELLLSSGGLGRYCKSIDEAIAAIKQYTEDYDTWQEASLNSRKFVIDRDVASEIVRSEVIEAFDL